MNMHAFVGEDEEMLQHLIVSCHFQFIGTQSNLCHLPVWDAGNAKRFYELT